MRIQIALGHQSRVGKDTFADYVLSKYGGHKMAFSTEVYTNATSIQRNLGKVVEKDPGLLQLIGEGLRKHYGDDVWVDQLKQNYYAMSDDSNIIVTDVRHHNEMEFLRTQGFLLVGINRPSRPINRNPKHISEIDLCLDDFDMVIQNDSSIDDFYKKIDDIIGANFLS